MPRLRSANWRRGDDLRSLITSAIIFALVVASVLGLDQFLHGPATAKERPAIEAEARQVPPYPGSSCQRQETAKPGSILIAFYCSGAASYPQLRAYYDTVLARDGWRFLQETHLTDWGRDLGGMEAVYCKGSLQLDLDYAGERAHYGWTYGPSVAWGGGFTRDCARAAM